LYICSPDGAAVCTVTALN